MRQALAAALCALALVCGSARAATVTLAWDPNVEADLAGYRVYYATNSLLTATTAQAAADALVTKVTLAGAATTYALSLSYSTTYFFRLTAYDTSNNESAFNVSSTTALDVEVSTRTPSAPAIDASSPTAPTSLAASGVSTAAFTLGWTASTDNVGVTGYRLDVSTVSGFAVLLTGYNNKDLGNVTSSVVSGLSAGTTHYARLRAYDAAGNVSVNSVAASAMTLTPLSSPDTTAPSAPASPVLSGATTSTLSLSWTASTDNVGVAGYRLDVSTVAGFAVLLTGYNNKDLDRVTSAVITGLSAGTTHYARLRAYDAAGNVSVNSVTASTRTLTPPDTTNPSAPASPVLSGATTSTLSLSWTASTDNVGVAGYRLDVSTVAGFAVLLAGYNNKDLDRVTSAAITGLSAGTTHYARLRAYDAAGNASVNSAAAAARTLSPMASPDVTAPVRYSAGPAGTLPFGTTQATLQLSTDENATCRRAVAAGLTFASMPDAFSVTGGTRHAVSVSGLSNGNAYTFYVRCQDAFANANATDLAISFTVSSTPTATVSLVPQDGYLNLDAVNFGASATLNTYTWPANSVANAIVMKFDLSSLPSGASIQSAVLNLFLIEADAFAEPTYTVTLHKIINRNPDLAAATGMTYDGTNSWTASACCSGGVPLAQSDISADYDANAVDKTPGLKTWNLAAMLQEWVSAPATNFGLLLNSDATKLSDRYRTFASVENANAGLRPYLSVTYTVAAGSDTTAPSTPSNPALNGATTSTLNLSWTTSTDNVGVTGYRLDVSTVAGFTVLLTGYNNKNLGNATSTAITGLAAGTTHYARLRAYDAAGNASVNSAAAVARTLSSSFAIEPGGQMGWGTGTVNAAFDDVKIRVRRVSGAAAVVSAKLFYEEVGGGASRQIVMSLSTSVSQSYEAILPSTHTALKAGWLRLRAELTDAGGQVAQSSWEVRVAPSARSAPDASARVLLPQRSGAGQPASADFGLMPAASRPGVVDLRLLAPLEVPRASGEREIDASGSSYPVAVYELKADDRPSSVFTAPVQLALAYPDADGDGLVDGTAIRAARLRAFWHDGIRWRLVGGTVDEASRLVRVPTMHFSSFALFPASAQALAGTGADVKAAERFLTPVPQDGFNDVATFGLGAREVEIFDMSGRSVFRATGGGTAAIVWTGRDGSGRVVSSGAYMVRIGNFDGGKQYQVIVVVK